MRYISRSLRMRMEAYRYCKINKCFFREVAPHALGAQHRLAGPAILGTEICRFPAMTDDQRVVRICQAPSLKFLSVRYNNISM